MTANKINKPLQASNTGNVLTATAQENNNSAIIKIATGITGLDELLYGGIPTGSQTLLLGEVGSGKTLFSIEFIYNNAKKGISGTFITIDQNVDDLYKNINEAFPKFTDFKELVKKGTINIVEKDIDNEFKGVENAVFFISEILQSANSNDSKVLVIDSLSNLRAILQDDRFFTRTMNYLAENLHNLNITSIITMEMPSASAEVPEGLYDESLFDAVIKTGNDKSNTKNYLIVEKLRYSKFKSSKIFFEITPSGIVLQNK